MKSTLSLAAIAILCGVSANAQTVGNETLYFAPGGSYNHTVSADLHNAENMLIVHELALAALYESNFESRLAVSVPIGQ